MKDKKGTFNRNVLVITNLKKMNDLELDSFMEEFEKGLDEHVVSHERLAFFLQLLLQMDPKLAARFMDAIAKKDEQDG